MSGQKIIDALRDAAEGNLARVRLQNGQTWARQPEWQPMETAPKDGTTVFGQNWKTAQRGLVHLNDQGEWEMVSGLTNLPMGVGFYPTHWMPLPEAPASPLVIGR